MRTASLLIIFSSVLLFAQEQEDTASAAEKLAELEEQQVEAAEQQIESVEEGLEQFDERMEEWGEEMEVWGAEVESAVEDGIELPPIPSIILKNHSTGKDKIKMGVYIEDLTFQSAYEMHYPHNYGVLITKVSKGTNADRAKLMNNDIVMTWNGLKVRGEEHLRSLINSQHAGDMVELTYFRNEEEFTTNITFLAPPPKPAHIDKKIKIKKSKKLSPGYGGGFVNAKYIDFDYSELNAILTQFGFTELTPERTLYFGGGGMGNIGKGWFIGGRGYGFMNQEAISIEGGKRHLVVENGFGGVTLTKKYPLFTKRLVIDFDLMIGGGMMTIEMGETNGYDWQNTELSGKYQKFQKGYGIGETSVGALLRIKNWFGFHARYGLMKTFTFNDNWTEKTFMTASYTVGGNAPELPFGKTATVGIWFGF